MLLATSLFSQTAARFVLLGMATGALTGLVGLGIVLVYRASGVLNFAAGALGAMGAFVCYGLRDDWGWPSWLAMPAGLLVGALLGALTCGVLAMIRQSSLISKLIATLALLSAAQGLMVVVWGTDIVQPDSFLPTGMVEFSDDLRIQQDRLILIVLVLVLAAVLRVVYSKTRFGLATSAVSENRRVAASAGWSTSRIELINFVIAGVLSALAAILLAPIVTLTAAVLSLSILSALAAALVGRFSSFGITVAAALAIGVVQSEIALFLPELGDLFHVSPESLTGLPQTVPLVIILLFTVISGRSRMSRGDSLVRLPLPGSGRVSVVPLVIGSVIAGLLLYRVDTWADALITTFGISIFVCSVVVVSGYAGQLSLCQYALGGFGAWVASKMVVSANLPFELALVVGVVVAIVAGVLVALPALRTRGVNLAVATLALALLFNAIIFANPALTGGFSGTVVPSPSVFGVDVDPITHPQRYGAVLLIALVIVGLIVANIRRGRVGRRMLAVRSNERAAAALGISVTSVKLYAFGLGAGIAALGGVLLAFRQQSIQFQTFDVFGSILLVQYAVLGGLGWVAGVLFGALPAPGGLLARVVTDLAPSVDNIAAWLAIGGAVGVVQMIRRSPDGAAALFAKNRLGRLLGRVSLPRPRAETAPVATTRRRSPAPLVVEDVTVHFGGVVAVSEVSFSVHPGEVVGLIGPNGAGKTTILDVMTGFTKPQIGRILLGDADTSDWSPERRARAGMARSWQAVELFEELTVRDNLLLGCDDHSRWRYMTDLIRPGRQHLSARAMQVIDDFGLGDVLDKRPSSLPQGHARLVGMARAIVGEPAVLLLDEPAAGLGPDESSELASEIRLIAQRHGIGVLVVEHDVPLLLSICDRIVALDFGRKIAEGTPAEISADEHVIRSYLGVADEPVTETASMATVTA
jgi:ABC-type branched-subunit amino acid transport system ATPase component/ABC-type branched-subunit amino acid transport system permease subunit